MVDSFRKYPNGACVLIHDDGFSRFTDNTLPHLNPSRPMAIAVIPEKLGAPGYMTLDLIKALVAESRYRITTCTHMLKGLVPLSKNGVSPHFEPNYEAAAQRLAENKDYLKKHGLPWQACVYARGDHDEKIRSMCAAMFNVGMGVTPAPWIPPVPTWAAPRIALEALVGAWLPRTAMEKAKSLIARSLKSVSYTSRPLEYFIKWTASLKTLVVLFDHGVTQFNGFTWTDVFQVLDKYNVPVIDLYEAIEHFGNRDTTGDYHYSFDPRAWGPLPKESWRIVAHDGTEYAGNGVSRIPLVIRAKRRLWQSRMR